MSYKIERLSKYIFDDEIFNNLANRIYYVTDHLTHDYPHHYEWYYQTHLPGVKKGDREVFFVELHGNICGVAFVKKNANERKVCTFYIAEHARNIGIGRALMNKSLDYLDTKNPLITMPAAKVQYFLHFMYHYDWKITEIRDSYYTRGHDEIVFNGSLD